MTEHMPAPYAPHPFANPPRADTILKDLATFLRRPAVLTPVGLGNAHSRSAWGVLVSLHILVLLLVILPLTILAQRTLGLSGPDAFDKIPQAWMLPLTVLIAPMIEEMVFRGWQTGRPRAFWLLGCALLAAGVLAASTRGLAPLIALGLLVTVAVIGLAGWLRLRRDMPAPGLYIRFYPAVYWIVALGFAAVHLINYGTPGLLTLTLVLPQLWAGILLGFTRMRLGLPASMLQHACANAAVMALTLVHG